MPSGSLSRNAYNSYLMLEEMFTCNHLPLYSHLKTSKFSLPSSHYFSLLPVQQHAQYTY